MKKFQAIICIFVIHLISATENANSRTVTRSNDFGELSLIETEIDGITNGECSYQNTNGENVTVTYEEEGQVIKAKSSVANILDPTTEAILCRAAADSPLRSGRKGYERKDGTPEIAVDLLTRICSSQSQFDLNQQFGDQLAARNLNLVLVEQPEGNKSATKKSRKENTINAGQLLRKICNIGTSDEDQLSPRSLNILNWLATTTATTGVFKQLGALLTEMSLGSVYITLPTP